MVRRAKTGIVCAITCSCLFSSSARWQTVQPSSIYSGPKPEKPVSVLDFVPPDQRIVPMPLSERIRLGAVPRRGMCSSSPASDATDVLLSGDGKMWVEVSGDPFSEKIVFHQEKLLQPWKGKPLEAPKIAAVLPEVRRLILAGEYDKALKLSLAAAEKTDTKPGTNNLNPHPAFEMAIDTPGRHQVNNYLRTTDFESGEVTVRWTDHQGEWKRRIFVSRPDNVVVQSLAAPAGAALNATVRLDTSMVLAPLRTRGSSGRITERAAQTLPLHDPGSDQIRFTRDFHPTHLILRGAYVVENGAPGYASVTRVVAKGGTVRIVNDADGARRRSIAQPDNADSGLHQPERPRSCRSPKRVRCDSRRL